MIHSNNLAAFEQLKVKLFRDNIPDNIAQAFYKKLNNMSEGEQESAIRNFIYNPQYKRITGRNKLHAEIPPEAYQRAWDLLNDPDSILLKRINFAIEYVMRVCFRIRYTYDELFSQAVHIVALVLYTKKIDFEDSYKELDLIYNCDEYSSEEKRFLTNNIYKEINEWNKVIVNRIWRRFIMVARRQYRRIVFTNQDKIEIIADPEYHSNEYMLVKIAEYLKTILEKRKYQIFELYYLKGFTDKEIGDKLNVSGGYAAAMRKKVIHKIVHNRVYIAEKILGLDILDMPDEIGDYILWNKEYKGV